MRPCAKPVIRTNVADCGVSTLGPALFKMGKLNLQLETRSQERRWSRPENKGRSHSMEPQPLFEDLDTMGRSGSSFCFDPSSKRKAASIEEDQSRKKRDAEAPLSFCVQPFGYTC